MDAQQQAGAPPSPRPLGALPPAAAQQQQQQQQQGVSSLPASIQRLFPDFLVSNPYFCAGFGLAGLGAAASLARGAFRLLKTFGRRRFLTSLEVPIRDPAYPWVLQWLIAKGKCSLHLGVETSYGKDAAGNVEALFNFVPSPGQHVLRYKDAFLLVDRQRSGEVVDFSSGSPWETLTLTALSLHRHRLLELLNDARDAALEGEEGKTVIYRSTGQEWRKYGEPKKQRPFESVVLADGVAESILADVRRFLSSASWYLERGIPYRRGYLLHGPPGCGKSSFVLALAGELKYNICVMNVADPHMTDDRLQYLFATVPPRSLLLLEDIDSAIRRSESAEGPPGGAPPGGAAGDRPSLTQLSVNPYGARSVTFSGLLNALDGVVATEERIIFLTTNQPERLPASLIRPGRVDLKVRIGFATPSQLRKQFLRFLPQADAKTADEFVELLSPLQISMAELQGFFLFCRDDCQQAMQMAKAWREADEQVVQEMQLREQQQQQQQHQQQKQQQQKGEKATGRDPSPQSGDEPL
ncbi:hypothetical protein Efla_006785 [Eimeria flavescens]